MKLRLLFFLMILFVSSILFAEYDISKPNTDYQKQNYAKAQEGYQKLADEGVENFVLFYNLGNSYFKLGKKGLARLYYERAKKFQPRNKELLENIDLLKSTLKDKEETQAGFLEKISQDLFYYFSINTLAIFGIISFIILMLIIALMIIFHKRIPQKVTKTFLMIFSILFIIFTVLTVTRLMQFYSGDSAVIIAETVLAYSGPTEEFEQVFTVHAGLKVKIEKYDKDWVLIKLPTGTGGWILRENIGRI